MDNSSRSLNFQHMAGGWAAPPHVNQFPQMPPSSLTAYNLNHVIVGPSRNPKPAWGRMPTQNTSSETPLIEELPSWFEELLNEPDTPAQRGHRRSTSDSFAYFNAESKTTIRNNEDHKLISSSAWPSTYTRSSSFDHQNRAWESSLNCLNNTSDYQLTRDQTNRMNVQVSGSGSCGPSNLPDGVPPKAIKKQDCAESRSHNEEGCSARSDCSSAQPPLCKSDAKRAKQYAFYLFILS